MNLSTIFMFIALTGFADHIYARTLVNNKVETKVASVNYESAGADFKLKDVKRYTRLCFAKICSPPLKKMKISTSAALAREQIDLDTLKKKIQMNKKFRSVFFDWFFNSQMI